METISISKLKAHLSGELKKVQQGIRLIVLDHNHPVAEIRSFVENPLIFSRKAEHPYHYRTLPPLVTANVLEEIETERADRW